MLKVEPKIYVLIFYLLFFVKFLSLSGVQFINNYPFITPDGFDWIVEGIYFKNCILSGMKCDPLPVLRPPVFVLINYIDYALNLNSIIVGGLISLSGYFTYSYVIGIAKQFHFELDSNWLIALALTIMPINYIKQFVLADTIAVCLSLGSVYLYNKKNLKRNLFYSCVAALISALTQTYALIPFAILLIYSAISKYIVGERRASFVCFFSISVVSIAFIGITCVWRYYIPHYSTPDNFSLLKISVGMSSFYLNTLIYFFMPFLFSYLLYGDRVKLKSQSLRLYLLTTIILFLVISFFYQWPETRFIYLYFPWFVMLYYTIFKPGPQLKVILIFLLLAFFSPLNYWNFEFNEINFFPGNIWIVNYLNSEKIDRGLVIGGQQASLFYSNADPYVKSVINMYFKIR